MTAADPVRLELLAALSSLSRLRPDWRLGQTLANLAMTAGRLDASGVWDIEDADALAAARTLISQYSEEDPVAAVDHVGLAAAPGSTSSPRPVS